MTLKPTFDGKFYSVKFAFIFENIENDPKLWSDSILPLTELIDTKVITEGEIPIYRPLNKLYTLDFVCDKPGFEKELNTNYEQIMDDYNKRFSPIKLVRITPF
jgi:hypothetical protein